MEMKVNLQERSYPIYIEKGSLNHLNDYFTKYQNKKIAIITDDHVNFYYGKKVREQLVNKDFIIIEVPHGETSKNFSILPSLYQQLLNFKLTRSDLIIALGARFSDRVIGKSSEFAKDAKIIHMDIDPSEINKNINVDVDLVGDLSVLLEDLYNRVDKKENKDWREKIKTYKDKEHIIGDDEFHPQNILSLVNKKLGKNTVTVTDVGQHQMWAAKYGKFPLGKSFITSAGLGTMGFGLGAAIGAKLGKMDKNVVLVTGDGSFRMYCN